MIDRISLSRHREGTDRKPSPGRSSGGREDRPLHDGYSHGEPTRIEDIPVARRIDIEKVVLNVYNEVVHKQLPSEKWFEQHMRQHFPLRDAEMQYAYSKVDQYFRDGYASLHIRDKIKDKIVARYLK